MDTPLVRLALVIHNHQPVGNFDDVFEAAYDDSYLPFLETLEEYGDIPFSLHTSGSLLEWLIPNREPYIHRVRNLVARGQVEILGGPFYEPILAGIPRVDRVGQIEAYSAFLNDLFETNVRGMWTPERVWEQSFAGDITRAGIEYTVLDDHHFIQAGLRHDELTGYYITEDEGRLFRIFPGSEFLRYTIPFQDPHETIEHLRAIGEKHPGAVVTFGDDGEKFGTWPGTNEHVYQNGWLRAFLDALRKNREWLQMVTLSQAVDQTAPAGKVYLPDCSYREMTEWSLATQRQSELHHLMHHRDEHPDEEWRTMKPYMRAGYWRNFRVKYPEANEMYARMLEVSRRHQQLRLAGNNNESLAEGVTALYRGQCNCPYWHGAFGGLYLPHLRNAVFSALIEADTHLERAAGNEGRWLRAEVEDFNLDGSDEVRLASNRIVAYFAPMSGGHLYELDIRQANYNLLATLNRREEPYHNRIREFLARGGENGESDAVSIHDLVRVKSPDLDQKLIYDAWPRKSLVDHFLQPGVSLEDFCAGNGQAADFATGRYDAVVRRSEDSIEAEFSRNGKLGPYDIRLTKTVRLTAASSSTLEIAYTLENLPQDVPVCFGVEFNFAIPAGAADRYYYGSEGERLGLSSETQNCQSLSRFGVVDEWLGIDASLEFGDAADLWAFPIETVSGSEAGFEAVHQSCCVLPRWNVRCGEDGRWRTRIVFSLDTSAAAARRLREIPEPAEV